MTLLKPEDSATHQKGATSSAPQPRGRTRGPGLRARLRAVIKPVIVLAVLIVAWQLIVANEILPSFEVAAPSTVVTYMAHNPGLLWTNGLATLTEVGIAFVLVLIVGIGLAVLISQFRIVEESVLPLLVASQVIPSIAIAPLLVLLLGFGIVPKVVTASIIAFFPILINTTAGLKAMPADMVDLARSLGSSRLQTLRKFAFPNAMPYIFAGARVSITLSVIGSVVGEFVTADKGLGYLVIQASSALDPGLLFSALVSLAIMGLLLFSLVRVADYYLVPWGRKSDSQGN